MEPFDDRFFIEDSRLNGERCRLVPELLEFFPRCGEKCFEGSTRVCEAMLQEGVPLLTKQMLKHPTLEENKGRLTMASEKSPWLEEEPAISTTNAARSLNVGSSSQASSIQAFVSGVERNCSHISGIFVGR